jgi:hypothetical protein
MQLLHTQVWCHTVQQQLLWCEDGPPWSGALLLGRCINKSGPAAVG